MLFGKTCIGSRDTKFCVSTCKDYVVLLYSDCTFDPMAEWLKQRSAKPCTGVQFPLGSHMTADSLLARDKVQEKYLAKLQEVKVDGKMFVDLSQAPVEQRAIVKQLLTGDTQLLDSMNKNGALEQLDRWIYWAIQLISIVEGLAFYTLDPFFAVFSQGYILPWWASLVISLIAGQIGYWLAERGVRKQILRMKQDRDKLPAFMFTKFSKLLIAFQGGWYAFVLNFFLFAIAIYIGASWRLR